MPVIIKIGELLVRKAISIFFLKNTAGARAYSDVRPAGTVTSSLARPVAGALRPDLDFIRNLKKKSPGPEYGRERRPSRFSTILR